MTERMPIREACMVRILDRACIIGPPPDGTRARGWLLEADGMTMDHWRPVKQAEKRLEELRMLESRSLMGWPL